ncbi:hypothetical protein NYE44_01530 [Paenibacillus sp. FSL L8-0493]|uniref:hypothetical protein n=1 Tax=Paenibacillus sp. FSL L8-0493 TaxID=2975333 RepID=UPI0030FD838E
MDGWIKLHRKIRENPVFNDMNLFRLWMICLTEATHKERDQMIGKQIVKLFPGEFVTGRFDLAEMYNRGLKKKEQKPPTTIWRWLENLENNEFVVINSNNKFSVVAVVKWLEYQSDDQQNGQQVVNKWSPSGQQVVTNKNVKNVKNVENVKKNKTYTPEFDEFWNVYPRKLGKVEAFKTWTKVIKNGESSEIIIKCATNYATDCENKQTEQQFIKHPKTFLNDERYKDYTLIAVGGGNGGKYGTSHAGPSEASRKAASRGSERFIGSPGSESGLTTDEVRKLASNFE